MAPPPHLHVQARPLPLTDYSMAQLSTPALIHQSLHLSSILQSTAASIKAQSAQQSMTELQPVNTYGKVQTSLQYCLTMLECKFSLKLYIAIF